MAIQKPRTRLSNFRVSEEEYDQLRQASEKSGARSLSDFARSAILHSFHGNGNGGSAAIDDIDRKVVEMQDVLSQVLRQLHPAVIAKSEHA